MLLLLLIIIAGIASAILTLLIRRYALAKSLLDIPNARSSHTIPTPRGGGLAFVIVFLLLLPLLYIYQFISLNILVGLWGAGILIAAIGFLDDKGHIAARWRLLAHFIAAIWLLYWLAGFPSLYLLGISVPAIITTVLALFYIVWLLNLYNFMDGIDGIASVEAVFVCVAGAILYYAAGYPIFASSALLLAGAVVGFLVWNFPPAKIFMGDAGSGFLGVILAGLSIQAAWVSSQLFWAWLILLGVFIVDATWTLIHRLLRKEKVYEAHRSHTYQFAVRFFGNHITVTLTVLLINIIWLLPIALLVASNDFNGLLGLLIAYLPLCVLAYLFKAGSAEN